MKKVLALLLAVVMMGAMLVACGETTKDPTKSGGEEKPGVVDKADYVHYSRAGYGKLGFRCDFSPAQFAEVRLAIAYCMDRETFAKDFTGGYGGVVDGPYYTGSWMYKAAVKQGMELNSYETSLDSAIKVLEDGGWVYDKDGNAYTTGVRYKKIPGDKITDADKTFKSVDNKYATTQVGNDYYMPLCINWYGTTENEFTDLLVTGFQNNANIQNAGFYIYAQFGEFTPMLGELYQYDGYGYQGTPMYSAFNFATGFTSAVYDYSYNMTIDPAMYDDYSSYYIKDVADIVLVGSDGAFEAYEGEYVNLDGLKFGEDYDALYTLAGKDVTVNDIKVNDKGLAYITVNGADFTLGLDFLTMAMVYNANNDDEYAAWFKYYMLRWNALLPEVPLYCNEYYDAYNVKIGGVKEHPTNPYWGPEDALIDWTSTDGKIIIGSSTELSGRFRSASFGVSSPGASNLDIQTMTSGLDTVTTTKEGGYVWNPTVVKSHNEQVNEDGSKTYTIEIFDDLKYSDGSAITAKDYLVYTLVFSTPVATQAAKRDSKAAMTVVGYDSFAAYGGKEAEGATKYLSGLRLLDTYKFSVTISPDYLPYFYDLTYAAFAPTYLGLWLGEGADIVDDGEGAYISGNFYEFTEEAATGSDAEEGATVITYTKAAHIAASADNTDTTYPYSGPYVVESYDASAKEATLKINPNFKGNYEGVKPSIETVVYKKIVSTTQLDDFKAGGVDVLAGITGGNDTNEIIAYCDNK